MYTSCAENEWKNLAGQKVDLAPWAYLWRKDRKIQDHPEAEFIPRRIKRQDEIYRTALEAMGPDMTKSIHYQEDDLLAKQLPKAEGELLTGLLWVGSLTDYAIELVWPEGMDIPEESDVEVRVYPTAWGWFGYSVDQRLIRSHASEDGRSWSYFNLPDQTMDFAYNKRVKAATEMVAVFGKGNVPIPEVHITSAGLGEWKKLDFIVEWGFDETLPDFTGESDAHVAMLSEPVIDHIHKRAYYTCLYSEESRFGNDSRFTCITDKEDMLGATVLLRDLAKKPICVPEAGLFFCPADHPLTAAEYIAAQKTEDKKSVRKMIQEHEEASDWEELLRNIRLWRCPDDTKVPHFPETSVPSAVMQVPDKRWEKMYNLAIEQLCGPHMWGTLAGEVGLVASTMEKLGLQAQADRIYDYFLASPGVKSDGDFSAGDGSLEWATGMRHDMGYHHEGTHSSTGLLIYAMMQHYKYSEDIDWLNERLPRIKQAADWIINELHSYMKDTPNREQLHCYGLMPPAMYGDYALPACDWNWYYFDNFYQYWGLSSFSDVLEIIDDPDKEVRQEVA